MRRITMLAVLALSAVTALALTACGTKTLDDKDLEGKLQTELSKQAGVDPANVKVACPGDQEVKKGHKFDCTLTAPNGDKVKVNVTLTNDDGEFTATVPESQ
jgi:hypothetical protein